MASNPKTKWQLFLDGLRSGAGMIPLVGQLGNVSFESIKQAFYETLSTTVFATLPIWFLPAVGPYFNEETSSLGDSARNGEVFIYCAVLLGPLIYVISKRYGRFNFRHRSRSDEGKDYSMGPLSFIFPYGGTFLIICAFMCFLAGYAITKVRAQHVAEVAQSQPHQGIEGLSVFVFATATVVFFLVCAYRNMLDDRLKTAAREIVSTQPREENAFSDLWLRNKHED